MADASGIQMVLLLKEAIKEVGERLENDSGRCLLAESLEECFGVTIETICVYEAGYICAIACCISRCPTLNDLVMNPLMLRAI